jgi:hypothetical protein
MRSIGGGVGAGQTIPGGNTTEVSDVGEESARGASVTTGGPEVPLGRAATACDQRQAQGRANEGEGSIHATLLN